MTDELFFQCSLDSDHSDSATQFLFGEWLDELGDGRAMGYRWMGAHKKHPRESLSGSLDWWDAGISTRLGRIIGYDDIDLEIWNEIKGSNNRYLHCKTFSSRREAEEALCRALIQSE